MKRTIQAVLAATALAFAAPALMPVAHADVTVQFNPGSVAYGYNDGYWDRDHAWHTWANDRDRDSWHTQYSEHYYDRAHTAVPSEGWRTDTWWSTNH